MSWQSKYLPTFFFSLMLMVLFTAFGCKKQEEEQSDSSAQTGTDSSEQVTYNETETQDEAASEDSTKDQTSATDEEKNGTGEAENAENKDDADSNEEKLLLEQAEKLAEIYGTYTNQDKESYRNLKDLKQYSTDKLSSWLDQKSKAPLNKKAAFYGVTTSALSSAYLDKTDAKSKILITVKKEEITANNNTPKVSYRIILMDFEKVGENWKLSGIYWQE